MIENIILVTYVALVAIEVFLMKSVLFIWIWSKLHPWSLFNILLQPKKKIIEQRKEFIEYIPSKSLKRPSFRSNVKIQKTSLINYGVFHTQEAWIKRDKYYILQYIQQVDTVFLECSNHYFKWIEEMIEGMNKEVIYIDDKRTELYHYSILSIVALLNIVAICIFLIFKPHFSIILFCLIIFMLTNNYVCLLVTRFKFKNIYSISKWSFNYKVTGRNYLMLQKLKKNVKNSEKGLSITGKAHAKFITEMARQKFGRYHKIKWKILQLLYFKWNKDQI